MQQINNIFELRQEPVDGETDWLWIKNERGAWDGPKQDWETSHKKWYFEFLKKRDIVVTAGGNQGMYARLYAKAFNHVYVFEPDSINFHCLTFNTPFDNVYKMMAALTDQPGPIALNTATKDNTGMFRVDTNSKGFIPGITLDSLNLPGCDLLQLDIEGFEPNALIGSQNTIRKYKPVIVLEVGNAQQHVVDTLMLSFGYEPKVRSVSDLIWLPKE